MYGVEITVSVFTKPEGEAYACLYNGPDDLRKMDVNLPGLGFVDTREAGQGLARGIIRHLDKWIAEQNEG